MPTRSRTSRPSEAHRCIWNPTCQIPTKTNSNNGSNHHNTTAAKTTRALVAHDTARGPFPNFRYLVTEKFTDQDCDNLDVAWPKTSWSAKKGSKDTQKIYVSSKTKQNQSHDSGWNPNKERKDTEERMSIHAASALRKCIGRNNLLRGFASSSCGIVGMPNVSPAILEWVITYTWNRMWVVLPL